MLLETETPARHILIVEDEMLLALDLQDMLTELGHITVAVGTRIQQALKLAQESTIDFAILDMNLAGTLSFPVAQVLRSRGIPFIFASGYGAQGLIDGYRDAHVLVKPYALHDLERAIAKALPAPTA